MTEYELLVGGLPAFTSAAVAPADVDPTQPAAPAVGLLQMPPVAGFIANPAGHDAWRASGIFPGAAEGGSLFTAAKALGMTTALLGTRDRHDLHLDPASIDVRLDVDPAGAPRATPLEVDLQNLLAAHPRTLAVVAMGGPRTPDRHAAAAAAELTALGAAIKSVVDVAIANGAIVFVTSRGATDLADARADFYGPGTSRHVPLLVIGPNARPGAISGQPGTPADLPATVLFALGAPTTTDFVNGTWATGAPVGGIAEPLPASASGGHALVRAFTLAAPTALATPIH